MNSRPPAIWVQLGHALKAAGRVREAETAYREALELGGNTLDTLLPLGHALSMQGKRVEAAVIYTRALDLRPSCALRQAIVEQLGVLNSPP
jgi:Flp pilus assembly protein TadD